MDKDSIDTKGARILLVDDTQANREVLCALLESEGYKIFMAPDGPSALRIADRTNPDLILLDVMMPGMNGYEVCRRLKREDKTRETPVIFITAETDTSAVVEGFQVGGVDYIPKPFRDAEVLVRVRNNLVTKYLFDEHRASRLKMEQELQTAHELHMGLMPSGPPQLEGVDIAGRCIPAEQVGGDFFQYFQRPEGGLSLALADVTGHAMAAAVPAVLCEGMLHSQAETDCSLEDLFAGLNRSLHRVLDKRTFVCLAMAQYDSENRRMRLSNGGYPCPYHYRAIDGEVVELEMDSTYPLGVRSRSSYKAMELQLDPGDRVVFCSDGIMEATNGQGDLYGFKKTSEIIQEGCRAGMGAETLLQHILGEVREFAGGSPQADDQTVVVLEIEKS